MDAKNMGITIAELRKKQGLEKDMAYLDIRNLKVEKIKETVKNKIRLFGSENKA